MKLSTIGAAGLAVFAGAVQAVSLTGQRLLIALEELDDKPKYSHLISDLESRGYQVTVESPKNQGSELFKHDERAYDHLVLLPPKSKAYGPRLKQSTILSFLESGGNVIVTLSSASDIPTGVNVLLSQLDIYVPPFATAATADHFAYDTLSSPDKHDVIVLPRPGPLRNDTRNFFAGHGLLVFPRPVGQALAATNPLVAPIVRAVETTFTYNRREKSKTAKSLFVSGTQTSLVSTHQTRNSARLVVLGSSEMLQDEWFDAKVQVVGADSPVGNENREFARQVTSWAFHEVGALRVDGVKHWQAADGDTVSSIGSLSARRLDPEIYRIKSDVGFAIDISEWVVDHWEPFVAPENDAVQLEFTMLSPFQRLNLTVAPRSTDQDNWTNRFVGLFRTPDQHGIFHFRVNYRRPFLSVVDERRQVTVRHFAHDEWTRSWAISGAWPWIGGLWSTIAGFLAFCAVWLYAAPPAKPAKAESGAVKRD